MKRILWFRRDLRVEDNKLLSFEGEVLPIFIFDKNILDHLEQDDRRVSFIFHYVMKLKRDLQNIGLDLKIFYDTPQRVFEKLLQEYAFDEVVAAGDYDSYARVRDTEISHSIDFRYLNETYLFKPQEILKKDGTPYLVFTPFFKEAMKRLSIKNFSKVKIAKMYLVDMNYDEDISLEVMGFAKQSLDITPPVQKLELIKQKLSTYKIQRNYLIQDATSHLSVDLRFGTISVREIVRELLHVKSSHDFIRELIFREFYAYLLFHFPHLESQNFKYSFKGIDDSKKYGRFINAQTGVPIIDAGITELLTTGNMHNRVRMIVASFFTKDLLLPWQRGESFFAKHLLDYDRASNVLSWQWSAGTGVDPQPYFRVFNPYVQSKKFDAEAHYIKKYLPQLKDIPAKYLHDENYLISHTIKSYFQPMLIHKDASKKAVELFKANIKRSTDV